MFTFGPMIAKNARSGRLLGGAPITVTTLDGVTLDTYTVDGQPLTLVTNHEGYAGTFRADTDQSVILARPRGGDPLPLYASETSLNAIYTRSLVLDEGDPVPPDTPVGTLIFERTSP